MEIVRLHLARIDALNQIPVHGFVIKHPRAGARAVMIGDAAYTTEIFEDRDNADLTNWNGQHDDRDAWSESLGRLHDVRANAVHFCHDTRVVAQ